MNLCIVGSVAFDTLFTPEGKRERIMGGSAAYASLAASKFCNPAICSIVGFDYPTQYISLLNKNKINTDDLQKSSSENTFHWIGSYLKNINMAETIETKIGVLEHFQPKLNTNNSKADILLCANNSPSSQITALQQSKAKIKALDSMNLWISTQKEILLQALSQVNIAFINDAELKQLTGEYNLIQAAHKLLESIPSLKYLVLKKGEFGAAIFGKKTQEYFSISAFPLKLVKDPTGAGDSFAGSFLGYLSTKLLSWQNIKEALLIGTVVSSFTVEDFGPDSLIKATTKQIEQRLNLLKSYSTL